MKNKFNWNRFYDELETADPKKFPFWMWYTHEMVDFISSIITGIIITGLIGFISFNIWINILKEHPNWTYKNIEKIICQQQYK